VGCYDKPGGKPAPLLARAKTPMSLVPRDMLGGGRTNTICTYYKAAPNEKITFYDFTSLSPFIIKTKLQPLGLPRVISENFDALLWDGQSKGVLASWAVLSLCFLGRQKWKSPLRLLRSLTLKFRRCWILCTHSVRGTHKYTRATQVCFFLGQPGNLCYSY